MRPTHVLVGTSDGEKLTGEHWITLEEFAAMFTYGPVTRVDAEGRDWRTNTIMVSEPSGKSEK